LGKNVELEQVLGNAEHWVESAAERLLQAPDPELEGELAGLDSRLVSLRAQVKVNSRLQRTAETVLQKRLAADITACERLYGYWLSHVEQRESAVLLEAVEPSRENSPEVQQAARTLAIAGKTYCRTIRELGEAAPLSYAWTRPSEKSAASQHIGAVTGDPLFKPPDRNVTVAALLSAAGKQVTRWTALLAAVVPAVAAEEFAMPSYVESEPERPFAQPEWNQDLEQRSWRARYLDSIGRRWEDLSLQEQSIILNSENNAETWKKEPVTVVADIVAEN
jgi:hypothetical protein